MIIILTGLLSLTTTATSRFSTAKEDIPGPATSQLNNKTAIHFGFMPSTCLACFSEREYQLQLQTIQVWLPLANRVVQLCLEGDVVVEVIASPKRWAVAQQNILENAARVHVQILVAEKWTNVTQSFGNLRIESRHVQTPRWLALPCDGSENPRSETQIRVRCRPRGR